MEIRNQQLGGVRYLVFGNSHLLPRTGYQVIVLARLADDFVQVLG